MEFKKEKSIKDGRVCESISVCGGSQGGFSQPPPDLVLPSAGQSLWVALMVPVWGARSHRPSSTPVGELSSMRPRQRCGDAKRAAARAEATGEIPQGRQPVIQTPDSFVPVLFLLCVLCLRASTAQQQEGHVAHTDRAVSAVLS